jgi:hypothetical protein
MKRTQGLSAQQAAANSERGAHHLTCHGCTCSLLRGCCRCARAVSTLERCTRARCIGPTIGGRCRGLCGAVYLCFWRMRGWGLCTWWGMGGGLRRQRAAERGQLLPEGVERLCGVADRPCSCLCVTRLPTNTHTSSWRLPCLAVVCDACCQCLRVPLWLLLIWVITWVLSGCICDTF